MERSKVKSAVILILLALDLALGYMYFSEKISENKINAQARENLVQVLEKNEIDILCEIPDENEFYELKASRDTDREKKIAVSLLGPCEMVDRGGNIHLYQNENGYAYFRGSGEFQISFTNGPEVGETIKVLRRYGVKIEKPQEGQYSVFAFQEINERQLQNSSVTLVITDGRSETLEGKWLISDAQEDRSVSAADAMTAVMAFVEENKNSGYGCKEIQSVQAGYYMTALVSGEFELMPVWDIVTDVGRFRVDGLNLHVGQVWD